MKPAQLQAQILIRDAEIVYKWRISDSIPCVYIDMNNASYTDGSGPFEARYLAFLETITNLRPSLHRYCSRMTGSVLDGEDVVQDALFEAYRKLDQYDDSRPPPFTEVREKYLQLREQNLNLLESLSEKDLDKPTKAPPKGREQEFSTFGRSFLTLALHEMLHRANVTDARRAAGRIALATRAAV